MTIRFGVVFPQNEIGTDVGIIREFAQTTEGLGYDYILTFDHVLGASPDRPNGWEGPYTHQDQFHEPFVLFSYLASITQTLQFTTGILILPQRQTALVAKQAATLDVLSGGRLRIGVGVGWNQVEYESLNEPFHNRGKRQAEQIEVLRQLWTKPLVNYDGDFHTIDHAGINPLPIQQPIPIWFGGSSDVVLRRMARLGDGWISHSFPFAKLRDMLAKVREYVHEAGRDPDTFGVDYHILMNNKTPDELGKEVETLLEMGVDHICIYTMNSQRKPQQHIEAIRLFKQILPSV